MTIYLFIALMIFFCITDIKCYHISNWLVLPATIVGCLITGFWLEASAMFFIGALVYSKKIFCGGDVKLLAMTGAFLGIWSLPAFILSMGLIKFYRKVMEEKRILPYAPFISMGCIPFLFM